MDTQFRIEQITVIPHGDRHNRVQLLFRASDHEGIVEEVQLDIRLLKRDQTLPALESEAIGRAKELLDTYLSLRAGSDSSSVPPGFQKL